MCSHTECVLIQNVFSHRMCSDIECVLIQLVGDHRHAFNDAHIGVAAAALVVDLVEKELMLAHYHQMESMDHPHH